MTEVLCKDVFHIAGYDFTKFGFTADEIKPLMKKTKASELKKMNQQYYQ